MINRRKFPIPGNPVITRASFQSRGLETSQLATPIIGNRHVLHVTSGRVALALVLREMCLPFGSKVLIPAYYCPSMILPVESHGAVPVFYKLNSDLSPDIDDLATKATADVKCLVVVHFFGFPQDLDMLTEFASQHSLIMIEDCAHAFFGTYNGANLGSFGEYAICSPWKFLPIVDGGCAISRSNTFVGDPLIAGGIKFQFKILLNSIENSLDAGKFGALNWVIRIPFRMKDKLLRIAKKLRIANRSHAGPLSTYGGSDFEDKWLHVRMSVVSKWISRHVSLERVVEKRRENYQKVALELEKIDGCKVLYPLLPPNVVPYVLPVIFEDSDSVYQKLRGMNIQAFRWDNIPPNDCGVSANYSSGLIQLPIHQELTEDDLNYVIGVIQQALVESTALKTES